MVKISARLRAVAAGLVASLAAATLLIPARTADAVVAPPGSLLSTGSNGFGQLGVSGVAQRLVAGPVDGLTDVVEMHSGREHGVALTSDGDVLTWGSNNYGQLGRSGGNSSQAAQVPTVPGAVSVTTGHYHTLALAADGSVWSWGLNASGQLGDGTTTSRSTPARVSGLSSAVGVAAGRDMSYAVLADGTVRAWGLNTSGQLGDGTVTNRRTPVVVQGLTDVTQLAGGRDHVLALRSDGSVWAWGWNAYGQVGDGTTSNRVLPVRVISSGAAEVVAGAHHSFTLRTDGTVASWGRNYRGQLGTGNLTGRTTPGNVLGISDAVSIGSGRDHGLAVLTGGGVRVWGDNPSGQLGDGTTTRRTQPVAMTGVDSAVAASGGQAHSFVHVADDTGGNQPPTARFTLSCSELTCSVDASGSTDDQGVTAYQWDFGDGAVGEGAVAGHTYGTAGSYTIRLLVTDAEGLQDSAAETVWVGQTALDFRVAAHRNVNASRPAVTVPSAVQAGDTLVLMVTTARDVSASVPSGWTSRGTTLDGDLRSRVWVSTAAPTTPGSTLAVSLGARSKTSLALAAYSGVSTVGDVLPATRTGTRATMTTPGATIGEQPAWVISYWADKSAGNTGWAVPSTTRLRVSSVGSGSGRVTAALADSGPLTGSWPGATATSTVSVGKAVAWTILLR